MKKLNWLALTTGCTLSLISLLAIGHAGNMDLNGGHYYGRTYHCHVSNCEMPDTFDRFGRRDGVFTDRRAREKFFNIDDWAFEQDFDGDCQSTRQEMLILTSRIEVNYTNPRNCVVRIGEWLDEYTGKVFKVATQIDLDHVIPLMYAHTHGGDAWPENKKLQFANDPINLFAVEKRVNRQKSAYGPSEWLPPNIKFRCQYILRFQRVVKLYGLDQNATELQMIEQAQQQYCD